jgi:hypothetical protein
MSDLDFFEGIVHGAGGIFKEHLLLLRAHEAEEQTGLGVVIIVILPGIPMVGIALQTEGRLFARRELSINYRALISPSENASVVPNTIKEFRPS